MASNNIGGSGGSGDLGMILPKYNFSLNMRKWINNLDLFSTVKGYSDDRKFALLKLLLPDNVTAVLDASNAATFSEAITILLSFDVKKPAKEEALDKLKCAKRGSQSWEEFGQDVRTWAAIAYGADSADREAKDVIFRQLSPEDQRNVGLMYDSWNSKDLIREMTRREAVRESTVASIVGKTNFNYRPKEKTQNRNMTRLNSPIKCYQCGEPNHIARHCMKKDVQNQGTYNTGRTNQNRQSQGSIVRELQENDPNEDSGNGEYLTLNLVPNVNGNYTAAVIQKYDSIYVDIFIENIKCRCLVDTGATKSCLSSKFYNRFQNELSSLSKGMIVKGADGNKLNVKGLSSKLKVLWGNCSCRNDFIIIDNLSEEGGIIGMDIMSLMDVIITPATGGVQPKEEE